MVEHLEPLLSVEVMNALLVNSLLLIARHIPDTIGIN